MVWYGMVYMYMFIILRVRRFFRASEEKGRDDTTIGNVWIFVEACVQFMIDKCVCLCVCVCML